MMYVGTGSTGTVKGSGARRINVEMRHWVLYSTTINSKEKHMDNWDADDIVGIFCALVLAALLVMLYLEHL